MSSLPVDAFGRLNLQEQESDPQTDVRFKDLLCGWPERWTDLNTTDATLDFWKSPRANAIRRASLTPSFLSATSSHSSNSPIHQYPTPSQPRQSPDPTSVSKMHIKCAALALGALAAVTSATPVASTQEPGYVADSASAVAPGEFHQLSSPARVDLSAQAVTYLYVCTDANFRGRCQNLESTRQGCYTLSNSFSDTISSLGPSQGATCTVWQDLGCSGRALGGIRYPGISNLREYNFNDIITSYQCN
ncbi:MAG: hypothetical protein LQ348_006268 [Seirophora lacunosa]|nr:MAG: hypothetical protein LQ348_006268 [Seirophora lacunosa]